MSQGVKTKPGGRAGDEQLGVEIERLSAQLERYRGVFDAARMIIGHEIVKPLTAISGYVELLEGRTEGVADERERRYFARIREAAARLREVVETFVQMLAFESGGERAGERELVDLRAVVEKLRPSYGVMRGRLRNAIGEDFAPVYLQRGQIEVVLDNLISNALKYSGDELPVTVGARLRPERRGAAERDLLQIDVSDEGIGIPEHELESIFTPFYRIKGGRATGGLGLGLALVKNIVALMGGDIGVHSVPGAGTRVMVSIPVPRCSRGAGGDTAGSGS